MDSLQAFFSKLGILEKEQTFEDQVSQMLQSAHEKDGLFPYWLNCVLEQLQSEDLSFSLPRGDFAPCMHYALETGLFHQLVVVVSASESTHSRVLMYSFFATLWKKIVQQEVIPHTQFSQATVFLLTAIVEHWATISKSDSEKECILRLLQAILLRVRERPTREVLFLTDALNYAPLCVIACYLSSTDTLFALNVELFPCVVDCFTAEDPEVVKELLNNAHILCLFIDRLQELLDFFLTETEGCPSFVKKGIYNLACCIDQIMQRAQSSAIVKVLSDGLDSTFFSFVSSVLLRGNLKARGSLLRMLAELSRVVESRQFVIALVRLIIQTRQLSNPNSAEAFTAWESRTFWKLFCSASDEIRIPALGLLFRVVEKMNWSAIQLLFAEEISGREVAEYPSGSEIRKAFPAVNICNFREIDTCVHMETLHAAFSCVRGEGPVGCRREEEESPLLTLLLEKLSCTLDNSYEENLLVTGILVSLCRLPAASLPVRQLHRRLFGRQQKKSLFFVLESVSEQLWEMRRDLESQISGTAAEFSLQALTDNEMKVLLEATHPFGQALIVFQEFVGELCEAAEMQKTFTLATELGELLH